jgi:fused signal recognition particle receptor
MLNFLKSRFDKVRSALADSRRVVADKIRTLFSGDIDAGTVEKLETILYESDLGVEATAAMIHGVRKLLSQKDQPSGEEILFSLRNEAARLLETSPQRRGESEEQPRVILITGVNGSGKTTSIAKLAYHFKSEGKKVLIAAADTFRAAAIEQLAIWAERVGVDLIKGQSGGDPAAVVYDALSAAIARKCDVLLIDTAGRLQNKTELMQELAKMGKIARRLIQDAPHETWLVIDVTTGQNAVDQAVVFNSFVPITGIIATKVDATTKAGILLSIHRKLKVPITWIGTGERKEDLAPFDSTDYVDALFDTNRTK